MKTRIGLIRESIARAQILIKQLQDSYKVDCPEGDSLYEIAMGLEWTMKRVDQLQQRFNGQAPSSG